MEKKDWCVFNSTSIYPLKRGFVRFFFLQIFDKYILRNINLSWVVYIIWLFLRILNLYILKMLIVFMCFMSDGWSWIVVVKNLKKGWKKYLIMTIVALISVYPIACSIGFFEFVGMHMRELFLKLASLSGTQGQMFGLN